MKEFVQLFTALDNTKSSIKKVNALVHFFETADQKDKVWGIALFSHKRPRRTVATKLLREWAAEEAKIPLWLFEESYHVVGDLAETIALVLPNTVQQSQKKLYEWIEGIANLRGKAEAVKKQFILEAWSSLTSNERFLFNKLITGGFRLGVSQKTVTKALGKYLDKDENQIAHRLMGDWDPLTTDFDSLLVADNIRDILSKPYPFYLAYGLDKDVLELGSVDEWQAEWKWDGIRGQLIKRKNEIYLWSRGEELVTKKFPEFATLENSPLDNWVIDGEILCYNEGKPLDFQRLQTRIGRKTISKKILESAPIIMMAYDLLEYNGIDIREEPIHIRREKLEILIEEISSPVLLISQIVTGTWEELKSLREQSRENGTEGLMLKRKTSPYRVGRKKGDWWKWKVDPMMIDAVMLYAMRGHGRRSNLFSDFTFAVWDGDVLVPFTKAYSGLTDAEFGEVTRFVNKNTIDRFGPVRSVKPELVFEIAFEGIRYSKRHKSGVALRFPRIKRWRKDKLPKEANTLSDLKQLL